jgi:hypothetical protein
MVSSLTPLFLKAVISRSSHRDLADLNDDGRLTRDGFAVACHLIQGKIAGKDIPTTLPASLMPPSMRTATVSATSPFHQPASEPLGNLIWDGPDAIATQARGRITQAAVFGPPVDAARPASVDLITYSYASRMVLVALPETYDARLFIPSW